ncbi:MAG: hypothetical protein ACK4WH_14365 [Phycisphaerales bacterium]
MPSAYQPAPDAFDAGHAGGVGALIAQSGLLTIAAGLLLLMAVAALGMAVFTAIRRSGGLSGLTDVFGLTNRADRSPGSLGPDELRSLMEQADQLADGLAADLDGRASRLEELIRRADERLARLERAESSERTTAETRPTAGGLIEPLPRASTGRAGHDDPITREIYRLSDNGLPPVEIARQLSQHAGKVELILALRKG